MSSGIYNFDNRYIGSTNCFERRFKEHRHRFNNPIKLIHLPQLHLSNQQHSLLLKAVEQFFIAKALTPLENKQPALPPTYWNAERVIYLLQAYKLNTPADLALQAVIKYWTGIQWS